MSKVSTIHTMTLDGGVDCLDFVNSGHDIQKGVITERIHSYEDLLVLSDRVGLFEGAMIQDLRIQALANLVLAEEVVVRGRKVRAVLYRLFEAIVNQSAGNLDQDLLKEVNSLFAEAMQYKKLGNTGDGWSFFFQADEAGLMAPIWKFMLSAHDVLDSGNLRYIKQCQRCSWFFMDKTKNHRKKWCSMESCGNSQKTKRYYLNKKLQGEIGLGG